MRFFIFQMSLSSNFPFKREFRKLQSELATVYTLYIAQELLLYLNNLKINDKNNLFLKNHVPQHQILSNFVEGNGEKLV